jgi:hypothetical protein
MSIQRRERQAALSARRHLGWLLTMTSLLAGLVSLVQAVTECTAYRAIAYLELAADGREQRTRPLRTGARYEYRVVIDGTISGRFNGAAYDAVEVWSPGEEPEPHNGLELLPAGFVPGPPSGTPRRRVFVPAPESEPGGQPVKARLDLGRLSAEMYLPAGEEKRAFEGALRVVIWERDRLRQGARAAGWAAMSAVLLTVSLWRLQWHRPVRRRGLRMSRYAGWRL